MYTPVVPSKTIPDSRPKWGKCFQTKRPKTFTHYCQRPRQGLKMGEENSILIRLMIQRTGWHTSTKNLQEYLQLQLTCLAIQQSFDLIFPYLEPISTVFTKVVHGPYFRPSPQSAVRSPLFIPCPCFIPSPYFPVRVLYLVRILYPVRSLQFAVRVLILTHK